jgi:hypothetical protein
MREKAFVSVVGLVACAQEEQPLLVAGVLAPPTPSASTCLFLADSNGPFLGVGVVDTTLASGYTAVLLIENESLPRSPAPRFGLEDVIVDHASVVDFDADGTTELDRFTSAVDGFVLPASNGSPGLGTVSVQLVSAHAIQAAAGHRILARVHVDGRRQGGGLVTSNNMVFPVDVCSGCLVSCPSAGACVAGQDQPVCL